MKVRGLLFSALAVAGVLIGAQGCGSSTEATEGRICTEGAYVFCRCADRTEGTKLCIDGKSFGACSTDGAGECAGGEIDDPQTGEIVEEPVEPGPGNPLETCPGKATAIPPGSDVIIDGDLTGAKDDMKGRAGACAAGAGGPDHVYRLTPTGTGSLAIKVQGFDGLNPTAYFRTTCDDENAQSGCAPPTAANATVTLNPQNVVTGRDYFLVVDGASASSGKYKITARLTGGSFCGDGKIDTNEACDDGNKTEGDGCSNSCKNPNGDPTSAGSCPGQPVHVWSGQTVTGSGSTTTLANNFTNTGTSCTVSTSSLNTAPEHVYEVTAHAAGTLVVTATPVEANFNIQLVARSTCATPSSQTACANSTSAGAAETMNVTVANNQKVYVAVDGTVGTRGSYNISFRIQ